MIYGYARVSTKNQASTGNSLEQQEKELFNAGADIVYKEAYTGTKKERPVLDELLNKMVEGDTFIATKLDRVARSLNQGSILVNELIERGITVNILNIGVMDNTPSSKLIRNIFFSFAEFERDMIVERTSEGRYEAIEKGVKMGRKETDTSLIECVNNLVYRGHSVTEACSIAGISRTTYYKYK